MQSLEAHCCINCETEFHGRYCPECGQQAGIVPNSFNFFAQSMMRALDLEQGILITFLHLFTKPAAVTDQFLRGNTNKYSNPIQYLFIALTITFLFYFNDQNWLVYLRSAVLVFIMVFSNMIFNSRYTNFYGHLMIAFYQVAQISILFLISALVTPYLIKLFGHEELLILIKYISFIAYLVWSSTRIFHLKGERAVMMLLLILFNVNVGLVTWVQVLVDHNLP